MSARPSFGERFRAHYAMPGRGLPGLADGLLRLLAEEGASVECRDGRCWSRSADGEEELPLPKSALRAVLARAAALCNEAAPGSVSPYGGAGDFVLEGETYRVSFINTTGEQRLEAGRAKAIEDGRVPSEALAASKA